MKRESDGMRRMAGRTRGRRANGICASLQSVSRSSLVDAITCWGLPSAKPRIDLLVFDMVYPRERGPLMLNSQLR